MYHILIGSCWGKACSCMFPRGLFLKKEVPGGKICVINGHGGDPVKHLHSDRRFSDLHLRVTMVCQVLQFGICSRAAGPAPRLTIKLGQPVHKSRFLEEKN
jgi:hypothetical protein